MHLQFVLIIFFPLSTTEVCPPNLSGFVTPGPATERSGYPEMANLSKVELISKLTPTQIFKRFPPTFEF